MDVKQRVEIISSDLDALKAEVEQGGGDLSAYLTKEEASSTYETQTSATEALALKADKSTTYTKTEVDDAIAAAAGGDVIVDGDNVKTKNAGLGKGILIGNQAGFNSTAFDNPQIAIGTRARITNPYGGAYPIAIGYQAQGRGNGIIIGNDSKDNGDGINADKSIILGWKSNATSNDNVILGHHLTATANGQIILGRFNEASNTQNCFIVGNGTDETNRSNMIEITTPLKVSTAGIEVNGTPYGQTATSTATLPSAGTGTTFDTGIEWTYIQTKNDFILDSEGSQIKFRYGFTKGSYVHYFGYILDSLGVVQIAHLELGAPTGSGTTALATWISSGAIPTT